MMYFDHGASTPLAQEVLKEMLPYLQEFYGNPSSLHSLGRKSKEATEMARMEIGRLFNKKMGSVYFTGSGTEADNLAIEAGVFLGKKEGKNHIITSSIEHAAILEKMAKLQEENIRVTYLRPDKDGTIRVEDIEKSIEKDTFLISIMTVNNEIGSIQPVGQIQALAREKNILFHTDAIQAIGLFPMEFFWDFDLLSLSAHKFNGPKGIGALITREDIVLQPLIYGGGQERGIRSGTENVASIVGMAKALERKQKNWEENRRVLEENKAYFIEKLQGKKGITLTTGQENIAPNFIHLMVEGIEKEVLLFQLDKRNILASAGSACSAGALGFSHVIRAIGKDLPNSSALRISLSEKNTKEELDYLLQSLEEIGKGK